MTLEPLAAVTDLPPDWQVDAQAERALRVASASIRDAAGVAISRETSAVVVFGGTGNLLGLPGPVISVSSVEIDGAVLSDSVYEAMPQGLWRRGGWSYCGRPQRVSVEYMHGLADVPDDIVALTCALAVAWLESQASGGGSAAGLKSVKLDDAAETYTDEAAGQLSPAFIPKVTRNWLAARFGAGVEVVESL